MTREEKRQYDSLSYEERQEYDYLRNKHPNWSHKQIMTKFALDKNINVAIDNGAEDVENNPEIIKIILSETKNMLERLGCFFEDVFEVIDNALDTLTDLIDRGICYVGEKLAEFWNWLTN